MAIDLIAKDIADLPEKTIAVKEKWKEIKAVSNPDTPPSVRGSDQGRCS